MESRETLSIDGVKEFWLKIVSLKNEWRKGKEQPVVHVLRFTSFMVHKTNDIRGLVKLFWTLYNLNVQSYQTFTS